MVRGVLAGAVGGALPVPRSVPGDGQLAASDIFLLCGCCYGE